MSDNNVKPPQPTNEELAWARYKVIDILAGCVLNIHLRDAQMCPKYLHEMTEAAEVNDYYELLDKLFSRTST